MVTSLLGFELRQSCLWALVIGVPVLGWLAAGQNLLVLGNVILHLGQFQPRIFQKLVFEIHQPDFCVIHVALSTHKGRVEKSPHDQVAQRMVKILSGISL